MKGKEKAASGDAAFQILMAYADASNHKLNAKCAAEAAGIGVSTAHSKIQKAKTSGATKPSNDQLGGAMPLLLEYAKISGHKLSAKHVAAATGVGLSTAHAKIAQAKSDAKVKGPTEADPAPEKIDSEARPKRMSTRARQSDAEIDVEMDTESPMKKARRNSKRLIKAEVDSEDNTEAPPLTTKGEKGITTRAMSKTKVKEEADNEESTVSPKKNMGVKRKNTGYAGQKSSNVKANNGVDKLQDSVKKAKGRKRKVDNVEHDEVASDAEDENGQKTGTNVSVIISATANPGSATAAASENGANKTVQNSTEDVAPRKRGRPPKKIKTQTSSSPNQENQEKDAEMKDVISPGMETKRVSAGDNSLQYPAQDIFPEVSNHNSSATGTVTPNTGNTDAYTSLALRNVGTAVNDFGANLIASSESKDVGMSTGIGNNALDQYEKAIVTEQSIAFDGGPEVEAVKSNTANNHPEVPVSTAGNPTVVISSLQTPSWSWPALETGAGDESVNVGEKAPGNVETFPDLEQFVDFDGGQGEWSYPCDTLPDA